MRLKNGEVIPTLQDVLDLVDGKVRLNIEIKSDGAGLSTAVYLDRHGYRGHVLLSSFREAEVADAKRAMPSLPIAVIFDTFIPEEIATYHAKRYNHISLNKKTVSEDLISRCQSKGIKVYVWTVDEEDDMRRLISWNVDGIYSNRPELLKCIAG